MRLARRSVLAGAAALVAGRSSGQTRATFRPEDFGARGDGRSNDTAAFAAMSARVNAMAGSEIILRPVTYLVSQQQRNRLPNAPYAFEPQPIMEFTGCSEALVRGGNGARLHCAPGLRSV